MQKRRFIFCVLLLCSVFCVHQAGAAFIEVVGNGATGWQNFTYISDTQFMGKVGFLVSNYGDTMADSWLLIDSLFPPFLINPSFENVDPPFFGYTLDGSGSVVSSSTYGYGGYSPTTGLYMAELATGGSVATASYGYGGTNGSILWTDQIAFSAGMPFMFDWCFASGDSSPYLDFSLLLVQNLDSNTIQSFELGRIAQSAQVPLPAAIWLFGSGLGVLAVFRKRRAS